MEHSPGAKLLRHEIMFNRQLNLLTSQSFFLFGARGTGKTSLIRKTFKDIPHLWINLLEGREERVFSDNPDRLSQILSQQKDTVPWVVIDEVQKVPRLLDVVHKEIEDRGVKFALTGSSARKLRRGGANLLAGRAFIFHLFPLTFQELGEYFSLEQVVGWGSLPQIYSYRETLEKELFLEAYVHTYLKEEIVAEQLVRNIQPFRRFIEIAAQTNGTIVNFSNISRDVGADSKTVKSYFEILEDTLLGFFLPAYDRSLRKQQLQSPKFYLFDCGVKRSIEGTLTSRKMTAPEFGVSFEHFIICEIFRLNIYKRTKYRLSYLATKGGLEIDLVLERPGDNLILLEIKSAEVVSEKHITNLKQLKSEYPEAQAICLCRESIARRSEGVEIYPWQEGLVALGF